MTSDTETAGVIVPITGGEALLRSESQEGSILVACDEVTVIRGWCSPGVRIAGPHVHREHTDAFYVLDGELTFEVGPELEPVTLSSGGLVAVPPGVAHAFRTAGDRPARWLTIHAGDGGFAAFMRGIRDGAEVDWDISGIPAGGGLPAGDAIVSRETDTVGTGPCRLRCALADIRVVEWCLRGPHTELQLHRRDSAVESFLVLEGELEVVLAGTRQVAGPGTLVSLPPGAPHAVNYRGPEPARVLGLLTPGDGLGGQLASS